MAAFLVRSSEHIGKLLLSKFYIYLLIFVRDRRGCKGEK